VAGDYFRVMNIPLEAGRLFTEHDTREVPRVVIVDERMAKDLWPGENPLGKRIRTGGMDARADAPWMTVVGVVGRIKQDALDADSRMAVYFPHRQVPVRAMNLVVRTASAPAGITAAVRKEIREIDPDLPIYNVRTMSDRVAESLARRRFAMLLLTGFAALALGLAVVGVYGVIAYLVNQGTRELGIRLALGATPRGIVLLIVRQGLMVALVGVSSGLLAAFVLTRFMDSLLFGIGATDPFTFGAIAGLLTLVALAASSLPARNAARIHPIESLRAE